MRDDDTTGMEHIARIIERLTVVGTGLRHITIGVKSTSVSVPRAVIEYHQSVVHGVLADLRGIGGDAPTRAVKDRVYRDVMLSAFTHDGSGFRCAKCHVVGPKDSVHVDHITPLARGGSNDRTNLQVLCRSCNLSKGAGAA